MLIYNQFTFSSCTKLTSNYFIYSVDGEYASQGKLGAAILANHSSLDVSYASLVSSM